MSKVVPELVSGVRLTQFASVGAVGAAFDLTVSTLLTVVFGVLPEYAKLVGAEVAIAVMFVANDRWTFAGEGEAGLANAVRRFLTSNLVRGGGLLVQFLVVRALRRQDVVVAVAGFDLWQVLPFPIAIASATVFNYVAESLFTWRVTRGVP